MAPSYTPIALQHVNLVVPRGTLHVAKEFYGEVIGFASDPVPQLQKDVLLWYVTCYPDGC
jgi:4-hydroxyphenylpyruvate dioxygenase-like putative hemolysin